MDFVITEQFFENLNEPKSFISVLKYMDLFINKKVSYIVKHYSLNNGHNENNFMNILWSFKKNNTKTGLFNNEFFKALYDAKPYELVSYYPKSFPSDWSLQFILDDLGNILFLKSGDGLFNSLSLNCIYDKNNNIIHKDVVYIHMGYVSSKNTYSYKRYDDGELYEEHQYFKNNTVIKKYKNNKIIKIICIRIDGSPVLINTIDLEYKGDLLVNITSYIKSKKSTDFYQSTIVYEMNSPNSLVMWKNNELSNFHDIYNLKDDFYLIHNMSVHDTDNYNIIFNEGIHGIKYNSYEQNPMPVTLEEFNICIDKNNNFIKINDYIIQYFNNSNSIERIYNKFNKMDIFKFIP